MATLKLISFRLEPVTIDFLQQVTQGTGTMREFIETACGKYIRGTIGPAYIESAMKGLTHVELCEMYKRHLLWQQGCKDYTPVYPEGDEKTDRPRKLARLLHHRETGWKSDDFEDCMTGAKLEKFQSEQHLKYLKAEGERRRG